MGNTEIDTFADIATSMDAMEKAGKVDPLVLNKIDKLSQSLSASEHFWLKNEKAVPVDAFIRYHAFRNMRAVLLTMRERFVVAERNNDNPKVVDDAKLVLPSLYLAFASVKPMETETLSPGLRSEVLRRIVNLRNAATTARMLPSQDNGLALDPKQVNKQTENFAETLRELFASEV